MPPVVHARFVIPASALPSGGGGSVPPPSPVGSPDVAGFRDAQQRKRNLFGEDVTFLWPADRTWPAGTALNGAGEPMDPTVAPITRAQASVTVRVDVAQNIGTLARLSRETQETAAGRFERAEVLLICDVDAAPTLEGATQFMRQSGELYEIVGDRFDGVSGADRYLVYGRQEDHS